MISHILFNLFSKYNIGSFGFRKILAILITALIFGLLYLTVRFTGMDIPNYTRNLAMLVTVDLAGFLFLMWKRPKEPPKEEMKEADMEVEVEVEVEVPQTPVAIEQKNTKTVKKVEKVEEIKPEEEGESKVVIKKIEAVEEIEEVEKS